MREHQDLKWYCPKCGEEMFEQGFSERIDVDGEPHRKHTMECNCGNDEAVFIPVHAFVNVYLVGRAYGGPEEGGWWYDYGLVEACVPVKNWAEAEEWAERLRNDVRYSNEGRRDRYSVIGDETFEVFIEDQPAENFPSERPRFE